MSIRLKLIVLFIAVSVIPLLFISALISGNYQTSIEADRLSQLNDLAFFKAESIESYFQRLRADIKITQTFFNIKRNLPVLENFMNEKSNPAYVTAKATLDSQLINMEKILNLSDIILLNTEGTIIYQTSPGMLSNKISDILPRSAQINLKNDKNFVYFSEMFLNKSGNKPSMLISVPALDFNNNIIGFIAYSVDMTSLYNLIKDVTGLGNTGETLIGKKIGNQVIFLNPLRHDSNAALNRSLSLGDRTGLPMQAAVQGNSGSGQLIDYRGKKVIAAWRYIPSVGWGMVAKIDSEEAFSQVQNLRNIVLMLFLIILALCFVMAFSIAQSISKPIAKLTRDAEIIGTGNLDHKAATEAKDEIGILSRAFDKMTEDLKKVTASRDELDAEIEERKQIEEALRESEERFATTLSSIGDAVIATDWNGRISFMNQVAEQLTGWSFDEASQKPVSKVFKIINEYTRLNVESPVDKVIEKGIIVGLANHTLLVAKNGKEIPIDDSGAPIKGKNGETTGVVLIFRDITERKMAEDALSQSEKRYRNLFNSLIEGYCIVEMVFDPSGKPVDYRFLEVNSVFEEQTGLKNAEGKLMREMAPDHEEHWFQIYGKIALTGEPARFINEARALNRWYDVYAFRVGGNESRKVAICFSDITVRKQAEENMEKARESAERANQAKSQFIAHVSHELRTPLNAILGYAQILEKNENLSEKQRDNIEIIKKSSNHLLCLINDLLDVSKMEAGKMTLEKTVFNFPELLQGVMKIACIQAYEKNINFDYKAETRLPVFVSGDETHLRQILLNLLSNAVKFTEKGNITFRIEMREKPGDNNSGFCTIHFEIEDTGIGIPPDKLETIFSPFFQLNQLPKTKGTGLGLTISRELVRLMGSDLVVQSEVGKGTTFSFDIMFEVQNDQYSPLIIQLEKKDRAGDDQELLFPSPDEVQFLLENAKTGNITDIRKYVERKLLENPEYILFIKRLEFLAKNINLKEIIDLLSRS